MFDSTSAVDDVLDPVSRAVPADALAEFVGDADWVGQNELSHPEKPPWERSKFERRASGSGIAFERNDLVPHGQALLTCDSWAACVIMSDATADRLNPKDDSALWSAIARHHPTVEPVLVNLPTFGGGGTVEKIGPTHPVQPLRAHAASRAKSFNPGDDDTDEEDVYIRDDPVAFWSEHPPYYRRFLNERVPRIKWLNQLRARLEEDLLHEVVTESRDEPRSPGFKIQRWGVGGVIVINDLGGRVGKMRNHPVLEARERKGHGGYLDFLLLADEFDRPAAIAALAREGIAVAFDPTPGWLNALVEPGLHGWLNVYWSGNIAGLNLKPELGRFHIKTGRLTVFLPRLAKAIELLLKRVGQRPVSVLVEPHPDDPECFFGIDLDLVIRQASLGRRPRRLRPQARDLLPADCTEQIEIAWCPDEPSLEAPPGLFGQQASEGPLAYSPDPMIGIRDTGCWLCDGTSGKGNSRPYCADCCKDAREGLFGDRGFNESWHGSVIWSLKTLAEIEFGGAPALSQLNQMPAEGPNSDLLMLCRMLIPRWRGAALGAERRSYAWTDWLAEAGLLTEGIRTSRGVTVIAKDGHVCRSLMERQIDDFFYDHGIAHEPEPLYPFDPHANVGGYRADWKLSDGTFVEALGFTNDSVYMEKAHRKIRLATRHQIPVVTVTHADIANLASIFAKWLPPEDARPTRTQLPPRPETLTKDTGSTDPQSAQNAANVRVRAERLDRCRRAVELQAGGATRKQIAEKLAVSALVVKSSLRDGKFYANPRSDPERFKLAKDAAAAQQRGLTRSEFRAAIGLTSGKADESWRDADVVFGRDAQALDLDRDPQE